VAVEEEAMASTLGRLVRQAVFTLVPVVLATAASGGTSPVAVRTAAALGFTGDNGSPSPGSDRSGLRVAWRDDDDNSGGSAVPSTSSVRWRELAASSPDLPPCPPSNTALCLNGNRFRVEVEWRSYNDGSTGVGQAVYLTGDTGYFWFFSAANVELVVKVLDGRPVNNHFWVFYGALSDVEYTLTVTDTESGQVKTYFNPPHNLASVADTTAF
jgi:hypothetical protein